MAEPTNSNYVSGAALDNDASLGGDQLNFQQFTLDAGINDSVSTVSVGQDITAVNVPCYLLIDNELIYATAKGSGDFTSCTRGAGGTTATSHSNGATVYITYAANLFNQLKRAIIAIQTYIGAAAAGLGAIIAAFTDKTAPTSSDKIVISDAAASNGPKRVSLSNLYKALLPASVFLFGNKTAASEFIQHGTEVITCTSGAANVTATITFPVAFAAAPLVFFSAGPSGNFTAAEMPLITRGDTLSATQVSVFVRPVDSGVTWGGNRTLNLQWVAIGT